MEGEDEEEVKPDVFLFNCRMVVRLSPVLLWLSIPVSKSWVSVKIAVFFSGWCGLALSLLLLLLFYIIFRPQSAGW